MTTETTASADALLPCPFCAENDIVESHDGETGVSDALCTRCGATGSSQTWNCRAGLFAPPYEPTEAMSTAGKHYMKGQEEMYERQQAIGCWRVMYAAYDPRVNRTAANASEGSPVFYVRSSAFDAVMNHGASTLDIIRPDAALIMSMPLTALYVSAAPSAAAFDGVPLSEAVLDVLVYDIGQFGTILSKMSEDDRVDLREGIALAVQRALAAPHAVEPTPAPVEGGTDEPTEAVTLDLVKRAAFFGWQHASWEWANVEIGCEEASPTFPFRQLERAGAKPNDISAPRDTDCEAIRDKRIGVLARAEDGSAAMTMVLQKPDAPRDFDPGTIIATLTLDDGRTASDRVTASWAAQVLRELGGARR